MRVKKVAFRKKHGITPPRMQRLVKLGVVKVRADGTVDEKVALASIKKNASPVASHQPAKKKKRTRADSYTTSRALREKYAAESARLKLDETSGLLVRLEDVMRAVAEQLGRVRSRLLAIPNESADILAQKKSPHEIQEALRGFVIDALKDLTLGQQTR
jgi:hypothetical protein